MTRHCAELNWSMEFLAKDNIKWKGKLTPCLRRQSVDRIIALSLRSNLTTQGKGGGSTQSSAILVNISDIKLYRCMVLRSNQSVYKILDCNYFGTQYFERTGCRAFAWNIKIDENTLLKRSSEKSSCYMYVSYRLTWSFSILMFKAFYNDEKQRLDVESWEFLTKHCTVFDRWWLNWVWIISQNQNAICVLRTSTSFHWIKSLWKYLSYINVNPCSAHVFFIRFPFRSLNVVPQRNRLKMRRKRPFQDAWYSVICTSTSRSWHDYDVSRS